MIFIKVNKNKESLTNINLQVKNGSAIKSIELDSSPILNL